MRDFAAVAARAPARTALRTAAGTLSYGDLAERVRVTAARLAAQGIAAHDRVMLACRPTIETIAGALALLDRRCAVLPFAADAPGGVPENIRDAFAAAWVMREGDASPLPRRAGSAPPRGADGESPLQALCSSGSSGQPKIVLRGAAQVEAGVRIFATAMALGPQDRVLALVPLEHSFGFNSVMLGALSAGAEVVLPRSRHPRGIVRDVEESGVTLFPAPPLFFDQMQRFAENREKQRVAFASVRACVSVGDVLPRATHDAFVETFGAPLWQSYGASEAGPALLNRSAACAGDTMALGQPYPEVSVDLRDEGGNALPDGEQGEIVVRSPAVGLRYLGEHDGASRISEGRFFTGDLGVRRDGVFHFAGRRKVLIVRAGRKIDPAEIERVLRGHPDVVDAAVRADAESGRESLQALVVATRAIPPGDLIDLCARSLESHKVPRAIEFRSALPRDAAGKLQRARLRTW